MPRHKVPVAAGIYRIRNKVNGKVYIGSAINVRMRWHQHRHELRKGSHRNAYLQRAWRKHGEEAFAFERLEAVSDPHKLLVREQHWLDRVRPYLPHVGYNIYSTAGSPDPLLITHAGRTQTIDQWAAEYGLKKHTLWKRLYELGRTMEEALTGKLYGGRGRKPTGERALTPVECSKRYREKMKDDPEYKRKTAESVKRYRETHPEYLAKKKSPETRAKNAAYMKAWHDQRRDDPEYKRQNAERARLYHEKMKDDPEYKRKTAERARLYYTKKKARQG